MRNISNKGYVYISQYHVTSSMRNENIGVLGMVSIFWDSCGQKFGNSINHGLMWTALNMLAALFFSCFCFAGLKICLLYCLFYDPHFFWE